MCQQGIPERLCEVLSSINQRGQLTISSNPTHDMNFVRLGFFRTTGYVALQVASTEASLRDRELALAEMQAVASSHAAREAALQGREAAAEATQRVLETRTAELQVRQLVHKHFNHSRDVATTPGLVTYA